MEASQDQIEIEELPAIDKREVATTSTIGKKLKEARELCDYTIRQAAKLLEIEDKQLHIIESGRDLDAPIPHWLIRKAAIIFDVSADFIYGLNADWEAGDPQLRFERDTISEMFKLTLEESAKSINEQRKLDNKIAALANAVETMVPAINAVSAFMDFWMRHIGFDEMPGGATFVNRLDAALKAAHESTCAMVRFKVIHKDYLMQFSTEFVRQDPHLQKVDKKIKTP